MLRITHLITFQDLTARWYDMYSRTKAIAAAGDCGDKGSHPIDGDCIELSLARELRSEIRQRLLTTQGFQSHYRLECSKLKNRHFLDSPT